MDISSELPNEPFVVADHPALDLLNTVARMNGKEVDFFQRDEDVLRWLVRIGILREPDTLKISAEGLCEQARELRDVVRTLIEKRKENRQADTSSLNSFLTETSSHLELIWNQAGAPQLVRRLNQSTPRQVLAPLAESAAELLAAGEFDLVRKCDNPDCVLWFYDRTKSHRRRWCSMAACGNRHKVAAYRQRQGA